MYCSSTLTMKALLWLLAPPVDQMNTLNQQQECSSHRRRDLVCMSDAYTVTTWLYGATGGQRLHSISVSLETLNAHGGALSPVMLAADWSKRCFDVSSSVTVTLIYYYI